MKSIPALIAFAALLHSPMAPADQARTSGAKSDHAGSRAASANPDGSVCAKTEFRGKNAKARRQACLERQERERTEALRVERRDRCTQNPRACEDHEPGQRMLDGWRDQKSEGHGKD